MQEKLSRHFGSLVQLEGQNNFKNWSALLVMLGTMGCAYGSDGETGNANKILVGKLFGKRPLERPKRKRERKITMDHKDVTRWDGRGVDSFRVMFNVGQCQTFGLCYQRFG
jgi:hypothetical protein